MSLTIAIPTFNNVRQLVHALVSLTRNTDFDGRILVINNGDEMLGPDTFEAVVRGAVPYDIQVVQAPGNLGWCGGINLALSMCETELFCMCNDDVLFLTNREFWKCVYRHFSRPGVGGLGPTSNYVSGYQNMVIQGLPDVFSSPLLIGFCAVYRTELLRDGLDETLPGGDDMDLSIRVKDAGFHLVVDRSLFVHHYGSQTGHRVYGDFWDSKQHQADTVNALCRKHTLKRWYECMNGELREIEGSERRDQYELNDLYHAVRTKPSDIYEHIDALRAFAESVDHVTEFGVSDGTTTTAFLKAKPKRLVSYDIEKHPMVDVLASLANGTRFEFKQQSTLAEDIEPTDMLFIDDLHTYDQVSKELAKHAKNVRKYILFHDVATLGYHDETGRPYAPAPNEAEKQGIMPAITEFLRDHDEWRIVTLLGHNNGLMALARTQ